ncbi:MAG: Mth938-like domain-containing protein [Gammaproteobacteria bacterium]
MKFSEDNLGEGYYITAYDTGRILVNGRGFEQSFILAPDALLESWAVGDISQLAASHFEPILALKPELVLLGTGTTLRFPEVACYAQIINLGIGVEVMDTGAACRTYNILMGEGRRVVAGLIL